MKDRRHSPILLFSMCKVNLSIRDCVATPSVAPAQMKIRQHQQQQVPSNLPQQTSEALTMNEAEAAMVLTSLSSTTPTSRSSIASAD